jgi:membrane-associated phospholipid phosphatase
MRDSDSSLGLRLGLASVAAVVLLVPFALIAVLIVGNWAPLHDLDESVTDALHGFALGHPGWVRVMKVWSFVFDPNPWRVAALALAVWLWRRGARPLAIWVALTMTVGGLLGLVLKLLVGRHRPDLLEPVARAAGFSFPSGHALNNALGAGVFVLVLLPFVKDRPGWRAALWGGAVLIPVLTAVSRVGLGVHFTSDVLAGLILGVAVVLAMAAGYQSWRSRAGRRPVEVATEGVEPDVAREA